MHKREEKRNARKILLETEPKKKREEEEEEGKGQLLFVATAYIFKQILSNRTIFYWLIQISFSP